MREIKFRGKRLDSGTWVYGSLFNSIWRNSADGSRVCYIFPDNMLDGDDYATSGDSWEDFASAAEEFEVDPATVGQYTGLKDKNGKEIYEGDKLRIRGNVTAVVVWRNQGLDILDACAWTPTNKGYIEGLVYAPTNTMEIIGNIHDSHELLATTDYEQ